MLREGHIEVAQTLIHEEDSYAKHMNFDNETPLSLALKLSDTQSQTLCRDMIEALFDGSELFMDYVLDIIVASVKQSLEDTFTLRRKQIHDVLDRHFFNRMTNSWTGALYSIDECSNPYRDPSYQLWAMEEVTKEVVTWWNPHLDQRTVGEPCDVHYSIDDDGYITNMKMEFQGSESKITYPGNFMEY
eukprot:TRINITY_DN1545_c0_g1_i2.p1 TRINITY_DN1545_c0_g1~~TRINITY_DN1545_c0_g1_i2.p1  ORF type:complete len:188 (-),score=14.38 TRINITY_DN1545_c0_g1_i2:695-1258(-)